MGIHGTFVAQYEEDVRAGRVRPLSDYLTLFTNLDRSGVVDAYIEYETRRASSVEPEPEPANDDILNRLLLVFDEADRRASDEPEDFGPYRPLRLVGEGGEGLVYEAVDTRAPERRVAIKVLSAYGALSARSQHRFRHSAQLTIGRLQEPGICPLVDLGLDSRPPWVAMPFIQGCTLSELIPSVEGERRDAANSDALEPDAPASHRRFRLHDPVDVDRVLEIFEVAARALHGVHEKNVVHRDVKPSNIMIDEKGQPWILDMGLARVMEAEINAVTATRSGIGSLPYMAPERLSAMDEAPTRQTDVWSCAASLYECLTGRLPFEGPTHHAMVRAIQADSLPDPTRANTAISRDLAVVLATGLEKDTARRYRTALELAQELGRVRGRRPIIARPPGVVTRLRLWSRRNPVLAGAAVALMILVIGLGTSLLELSSATQALEDETVVYRTEQLIAAAAPLVPELLEDASPFQTWFANGEKLLTELRPHVRELRSVKDPEHPRHDALRKRRDALRHLEDTILAVRTRAELAPVVRRARDRWSEFVAAHGADRPELAALPPQPGLSPLGFDRHSGLLECWVVGTGTEPRWVGEPARGHCVLTEESALVLVFVPRGVVRMGNAPYDFREDAPQMALVSPPCGPQTIPAFWLSKFETTNAQWARMTARLPRSETLPEEEAGLHPRHGVTWTQCDQLARVWNLKLPTEAQWERAARGDFDSRFGTRGAELEEIAWHFESSPGGFHPVGELTANDFGFHDMLGNALEWTRDEFLPYEGTTLDPETTVRMGLAERSLYVQGDEFLPIYVLRGGCVAQQLKTINVPLRSRDVPNKAGEEYGVRYSREVTKAP